MASTSSTLQKMILVFFCPVFLTDARVESEFIGYCCTLPSVESITGFVAYAEKNKFIFGFLDDKYDVACVT
ncbi:hypothetical protein T09_10408 [Trichinella sp. T9]|nr:hypothetical protein T09_10408 [Trichinella sp. T9]